MKMLCLILGVIVFGFLTTGCATHAAVHTPIVGVSAGGAVQ